MPLAPLEKVLCLKEVPLFAELAPPELASIAPIAHEVPFAAGAVILRQGDAGDRLYVIVEGRVEVTIDGVPLAEPLEGPAVIGELAILGDAPRAATCTALTEVLALELRHDDFWDLLHAYPEVGLGVVRMLLGYLET